MTMKIRLSDLRRMIRESSSPEESPRRRLALAALAADVASGDNDSFQVLQDVVEEEFGPDHQLSLGLRSSNVYERTGTVLKCLGARVEAINYNGSLSGGFRAFNIAARSTAMNEVFITYILYADGAASLRIDKPCHIVSFSEWTRLV